MHVYIHAYFIMLCTYIFYTFYFNVKYNMQLFIQYKEFWPINPLKFLFGINQTHFIAMTGL